MTKKTLPLGGAWPISKTRQNADKNHRQSPKTDDSVVQLAKKLEHLEVHLAALEIKVDEPADLAVVNQRLDAIESMLKQALRDLDVARYETTKTYVFKALKELSDEAQS